MLAFSNGQIGDFKFIFTVNGSVHNPLNNFNSIINATRSSGVTTFTTSQPHNLVIGDRVSVSGVNPVSYNFINQALKAITASSFSVEISPEQSYISGGTSSSNDIYFTIIRGEYGDGPIIDGPFSYLSQNPNNEDYSIDIQASGEVTFSYKIPVQLFPDKYYIQCQTTNDNSSIYLSSNFQVRASEVQLNPVVISNNSTFISNFKSTYEDLNNEQTSTVLLIGHANGLGINNPIKIRSIQSAIDLLGADINNPLLRGVLNAYAAGARDIIICAAAPASEYVESYLNRNTQTDVFSLLNDSVNENVSFYERYYDRLEETYSLIQDLDFIDIIVPLETSIIKTGGVDFVTQLANYCADFHNTTGYVQMGVIGSHSGGLSHDDVSLIEESNILTNKLTQYSSGSIATDYGRFVVPIYGEAVYQHQQIKTSYVSSIAASFAGMMSSYPLNMGIIRSRIPGAMSVYGANLTNSDHQSLENIGINTIYRGKKTRSTTPYEVYISNEYTLSDENSTLHKVNQMRLISLVLGQVKNYSYSAIGKFSYDDVIFKTKNLLSNLKNSKTIVDFALNAEADPNNRGKIILYISLLSAFGLKKIDFSLSAGPEV